MPIIHELRLHIQLFYQLLNFGMIVSSALMIWKGLMVVTGSESPIVVVLRWVNGTPNFRVLSWGFWFWVPSMVGNFHGAVLATWSRLFNTSLHQYCFSLVSRPFEGEEKGPDKHCMHVHCITENFLVWLPDTIATVKTLIKVTLFNNYDPGCCF